MARNFNHNGQVADLNYDDICMFPYNSAIMAVTSFTTTHILKFVYIFPFHYDFMTLVSSDTQQQKYSTPKINDRCEEQNLLYGINLRYLIHFPLPVNTYSHYCLLL